MEFSDIIFTMMMAEKQTLTLMSDLRFHASLEFSVLSSTFKSFLNQVWYSIMTRNLI
jgi:hypothetical protein